MKKLVSGSILALSLSIIFANAVAASNNFPPLDTISFPLSVDQWATSSTARVIVGINATVDDAQLNTINSGIMANLQKIQNSSEWHITQFELSKNQSGLNQLFAQAEVRVPENVLTDLRKNLKEVSKPGATYSIDSIDFSPSPAEIEKVREELRAQVYSKVQGELQRLNKIYSDEKFHLHSIEFTSATPGPMPVMRTMLVAAPNVGPAAPPATTMVVSNKVEVDANVVLASMGQ